MVLISPHCTTFGTDLDTNTTTTITATVEDQTWFNPGKNNLKIKIRLEVFIFYFRLFDDDDEMICQAEGEQDSIHHLHLCHLQYPEDLELCQP